MTRKPFFKYMENNDKVLTNVYKEEYDLSNINQLLLLEVVFLLSSIPDKY